jgi:hypothetical protein
MRLKKSAVLHKLASNRAEYVGYCRYLNNHKVSWKELEKENNKHLPDLCKGKHVLLINDTTEFNYQPHVGFLDRNDKDLGPTTDNETIGFYCHPGLVVDSETGMGLGFSYIKIWNRKWSKQDKHERNYKAQRIEDKESYRWIECGIKSKKVLQESSQITVIADRESDIYEEFVLVPDKRTHLVIRSRGNRSLSTGQTLKDILGRAEVRGTYDLRVRTTKKRTGRQAQMEVKYTSVSLLKPRNRNISKDIPDNIAINVVEAKEVVNIVPKGEAPVHWVLFTTHNIDNIQDAMRIIFWYGMRWQIELLFGTLKSAGLNVESSELETGSALKKLCVIALQAALLINQLRQARDDESGMPASIAFSNAQIILLAALVKEYEGKTVKQKNPHPEKSLAWASWVIARMGGWKGYSCESPPGIKTFKYGIEQFFAVFVGFLLYKKICA